MIRRPAPAFTAPTAEPFSEMNTTPLIDVMLVLLIMFIITIPITSHKVPLDLPQGPLVPREEQLFHRLDIDAGGRLSWDGAALAEAHLPARLAGMADSGAELHFRADGETRYEDFDRVLATVKRANIDKLGLVDNQRFAAAVAR